MLGLIRRFLPYSCPPDSFEPRCLGELNRSNHQAVHNSPPSSVANPCWRNQSHIARRTEEGCFRGALKSGANSISPLVDAKRRRESARRFFVHARKSVNGQRICDDAVFGGAGDKTLWFETKARTPLDNTPFLRPDGQNSPYLSAVRCFG